MNPFGVSFQPGADQQTQQGASREPGSPKGVQEAIKVLSLRLPKVVGSQSVAPSPLLTSQGSGGRPHVDSIVEQVLAKYFPTGDNGGGSPAPMMPSEPSAPEAPPSMPSFTGMGQPSRPQQTQGPVPQNFWTNFPSIIVGVGNSGDTMSGPDGRPITGQPQVPGGPGGIGGVFESLPDLRQNFDWLPSPQDQGPPLF